MTNCISTMKERTNVKAFFVIIFYKVTLKLIKKKIIFLCHLNLYLFLGCFRINALHLEILSSSVVLYGHDVIITNVFLKRNISSKFSRNSEILKKHFFSILCMAMCATWSNLQPWLAIII